MTTFIEDSPRAFQAGWIAEACTAGYASAAVLTPWASPWNHRGGPGKKPGIRERSQQLNGQGVPIWFDAVTHALQMGGVGDFRYYDEFDMWGGPRGDLSTHANRDEHIRKVFDIQDELGSPRLGPTVLLHTGQSQNSVLALDMARQAVATDPGCWLTIAGTAPLWSSGVALDAHVGALATLEPAGWFIGVVRPLNTIPVGAIQDEVFGMCRTVRALSEFAPVHVSHGDMAALPAIAAGATTTGTGWDKRQRVMSYSDYAARTPSSGGGAWFERPTLRDLVGSLSTNEASILNNRNATLVGQLGGLPAPGPKEAFMHHASAVASLVSDIASGTTPQDRYQRLETIYLRASNHWSTAQIDSGSDTSSADWIDPFSGGLGLYGVAEGW